ncbi:MAG: DEAD/DEAH box helicase [Caldilineaceae bacterium]|nr:DEAD/DEAH box helicase [Caldilineaceae bacterium]
MTTPRSLKSRLAHAWTPFFARHGSFTPVQEAAIPPILDGHSTLVIAATAGGKTEAAIVPLLERYCFSPYPGSGKDGRTAPSPKVGEGWGGGLRILYLCPTRALVRDLYERLRLPLEQLEISFAMKSGDTGPVSTSSPPTVLITTPESTDSLLTRAPRLLAEMQAIVLDEIHLLDGGPRGDQLRCLLRRIENIRSYHQQQSGLPATPLQRIALSATVPDPAGIAARYLSPSADTSTPSPLEGRAGVGFPIGADAQIISVSGRRELDADIWPLHGLESLTTALALTATRESGPRKFLIFCNSRSEVEQTAAFLRGHLPFESALFTHYSNLDTALRQEVEEGFAEASVAICVSTSTLELGIDIGSIDEVVLIGPPPSLSSFQQRIGRGGRRTGVTRVLCMARSSLEEVRFQALIGETVNRTVSPTGRTDSSTYRFLPSVLVQQSFSILAQSPTGGIRLADLRRAAPEEIEDETLAAILGHLTRLGYLRSGRLGEWRAAEKLDELVDKFEIYANIGGDPLPLLLVDAFSGRTLATVARSKVEGETLRLGGHILEVVWRDRYRVGVRRRDGKPVDDQLRFATTPFAVPLESGRAVAGLLGLAGDVMLAVPLAEGTWLFHFWGDVYGSLLAEMLDSHFGGEGALVMAVNEFCLYLPGPLPALPGWEPGLAQRALYRLLPRVEPLLELGRFHSLLPPAIAREAVLDRLDLPAFEQLYRAARVVIPPSGLRARLEELL